MTRHIALLAYPDCQLLDISGPWQVFASANALSPQPLYRLTYYGVSPSVYRQRFGAAATSTVMPTPVESSSCP